MIIAAERVRDARDKVTSSVVIGYLPIVLLFIYRSNLNDIAVSGAQCRLYRYLVKSNGAKQRRD